MKFARIAKWEKRQRCGVILREWNDAISMHPKQCRDDAYCTIEGTPHCKGHAQSKALAYVLENELEPTS